MMREQKSCRTCGSETLELVCSLGWQSITGFLLPGEEPRRGPLELALCRTCALVQLAHNYPGDMFFRWYGYRSGTNPMMVAALRQLATEVAERVPLSPRDIVLDIGSNDGTLLRQYPIEGLRKIGFDPAENLGPVAAEGLDLLVNDYYRSALLAPYLREHGPVKAVTAAAMFYELDDPVRFLAEVREVMAPEGLLVIQMNYLPTMLEQNGYDNIVHEHTTFFSLSSLIPVLRRGGFNAIDVEKNAVNGGSFRVWCAHGGRFPVGIDRINALLEEEAKLKLDDPATYEAFTRRLLRNRESLRAIIEQVQKDGKKIYVYGASTRGLAIMEYSGLDSALIEGAAERNPDKYGRFYGGTGIPCVPEAEAREKADYFLILPHHFLDEFVKREAEWLARGGVFIVPLPTARLVGAGGIEVPLVPAVAAAG